MHAWWHPAAVLGIGDVSGTKWVAALVRAGPGIGGLVRVKNGAHAPRRACAPPGAPGGGRRSSTTRDSLLGFFRVGNQDFNDVDLELLSQCFAFFILFFPVRNSYELFFLAGT